MATHPQSAAPIRPLAGIACMATAAMLYGGFDTLAKWLAADFSPFQIVCFRGLFAFLPWALWLTREAEPARVHVTPQRGLQILRGVLGFAALSCFAFAFRVLPLAIAMAIAYSAPLYTTLLARPLLGERVGLVRWLAVAAGFAGVLIVTRPGGAGDDTGALWAVTGALLYAASSLLSRRLGTTDRAPTTMLYSMTVYTVLGGMTLPFVWHSPGTGQWIAFIAIGTIGGLAQFFLFQAYRHAPAATVSPFEYTILAWGVVWGWIVWRELPDAAAVLGIAVIAVAGLALLRHEHRAAPEATRPA